MYRGSIRAIEFSECEEFLATVDTDRCVSVFRSLIAIAMHSLSTLRSSPSNPYLIEQKEP